MSLPFLLEIGTEEIPASYLAPYSRQLQKLFEDACAKLNLSAGEYTTVYTPRRLTLFCPELCEQQPEVEQELKGPPVDIAFKDGQPTKAAEAFAAKTGLAVDEIERRTVGDREYLFARIITGGATATDLLPDMIITIIRGMRSPKSMRWEDKPTVFARPIRWLTALFGQDVIPVDLDGLTADRVTYGHRFLNPAPISLERADWHEYIHALGTSHVMPDSTEREKEITQQLLEHGASEDKLDRQLVTTCANLVEWPNVVRGTFSTDYLELPEPVLVTSLKKHQKSFPIHDEHGDLTAGFLSVANNDLKDTGLIRDGYERVIVARLADARFFWDEDRKKTLADRVDNLKSVVFQQELGTYYAKAERVQALVRYLAEETGQSAAADPASRAALLARADLVTAMVYEFPELQGTMGSIYARVVDNEPESVTAAIREMYQPRTADDALPETIPGALLSIADKVDTITGCCSVGLGPTGSADPYALRRQALGALRIMVTHDLRFSLAGFIDSALNAFSCENPGTVRTQVLQLFQGRFETILKDSGIRYDIINAVMASGWDTAAVAWDKGRQLMAILDAEEFRKACTVVERCHNITRDVALKTTRVNTKLFTEPLESEIWEKWLTVREPFSQLAAENKYTDALNLLVAELYDVLHTYFDEVRVNVDDEKIRLNRHRMLRVIRDDVIENTADLSQVVFENEQP
jgi:glycyl-tRNA synthetase beta chain